MASSPRDARRDEIDRMIRDRSLHVVAHRLLMKHAQIVEALEAAFHVERAVPTHH